MGGADPRHRHRGPRAPLLRGHGVGLGCSRAALASPAPAIHRAPPAEGQAPGRRGSQACAGAQALAPAVRTGQGRGGTADSDVPPLEGPNPLLLVLEACLQHKRDPGNGSPAPLRGQAGSSPPGPTSPGTGQPSSLCLSPRADLRESLWMTGADSLAGSWHSAPDPCLS